MGCYSEKLTIPSDFFHTKNVGTEVWKLTLFLWEWNVQRCDDQIREGAFWTPWRPFQGWNLQGHSEVGIYRTGLHCTKTNVQGDNVRGGIILELITGVKNIALNLMYGVHILGNCLYARIVALFSRPSICKFKKSVKNSWQDNIWNCTLLQLDR